MKKPNLVTAINFYDCGQPIQILYVDSVGLILDCQPSNGELVVGSYVVDHDKLKNGSYVYLLINGEVMRQFFPVRNTWLLNEAESNQVYSYYEQWINRISEIRSA